MAIERYTSKTDVVVKLVLVFFISLLSFSIGTFVGKKFSDNQHKLSELEPGHIDPASGHGDGEETNEVAGEHTSAHGDRSVASIAHDVTDVKPNQALSDEEIAKLAEEFVTDDEGKDSHEVKAANTHGGHLEASAEHGSPASSGHEPTESHKETPMAKNELAGHGAAAKHETRETASVTHEKKAEPSSAAHKVAEGHDPAMTPVAHKEEKGPKAPTTLPKEVAASAIGKYTVQVASYPKEEEAQNMSNDLKNKGFSAFYVPAKVKGDTWYRVSVGLFTTQKEAQAYRNDLLARAKVTSAIVQKIAQ
jgi:cell division protein FtsN